MTVNLTSTRREERFLVRNARDATFIGTPLGLIEGIVAEGDAVVVDADKESTTYECLIWREALTMASGDSASRYGREPGSETNLARIVVNAAALPERIDAWGTTFTFSEWGSPSKVAPPDEPTMDWLAWEMRDFGIEP